MAKIDYKFWYIRRDDDVHISECAVRFFEGDMFNIDVTDPLTGDSTQELKYKRTKRLKKTDLPFLSDKKTKKDVNGRDTVIYTNEDFGVITDDDELRAFLNGEMKKDTTRDNIDEQVEENIIELKKQKIK